MFLKAGYIGLLKLIKAVLSLGLLFLSIHFFGLTRERDILVLVLSFTGMLSQVFFGPIIEIFRVKFITQSANIGEVKALEEVSSLNTLVFLFSSIVVFFLLTNSSFSFHLISPGVNQIDDIFFVLLIFASFSIITNQFINQLQALLNVYNEFLIPEILLIIGVLINILFVVFFQKQIGILSLIIGQFVTQILSVFIFYMKAKKIIPSFKLFSKKLKDGLVYWKFAAPFWITFSIGQLVSYSEKAICSFSSEGYVSMFDYCRKIIEMPMALILGIVSSYLSVKIASLLSEKKYFEGGVLMVKSIRGMFLIVFPILLLLICNGNEIFQILFNTKMSFALKYDFKINLALLSIMIFTIIVTSLVNIVLIAQEKVFLTITLNAISLGLNVALNIVVFSFFKDKLYLLTFNAMLCSLLLAVTQIRFIVKEIYIIKDFIKILILFMFMLFVCFLVFYFKPILFIQVDFLHPVFNFGILFLQELLMSLLFIGLYLFVTKSDEYIFLLDYLKKKKS